jgi:hypothetical protein
MSTAWQRLRWPLALGAGALLGFLALVAHGGLWARLGIEHFADKPYFLDLVAVLAAGQAQAAGIDPYVPPNPFDPFGRPHVYGPWWLAGGRLGLTVADARWLGPLLALAFVATAAAVLAPRRPAATLVALALLVSPPVLLGLERGNNDLVIFLLLAAAGALLARREKLGGPAGAALVWLAAGLKIYPVAALPMLAARAGPRGRTLARVAVAGVFCAAVFLLWRADFARAARHQPEPDTIFAHGLGVLRGMAEWPERVPAAARAAAAGAQWAVFGAALASAAWFFGRRARALWTLVPTTGATAALFVGGGAAWCACWLANTNYPYRAVLLLLPARLWVARASAVGGDRAAHSASSGQAGSGQAENGAGNTERAVSRGLLLTAAAAFWLTPAKTALLVGPYAGLGIALGAEQALVLALTAALTVSLVGWVWRRWDSVA